LLTTASLMLSAGAPSASVRMGGGAEVEQLAPAALGWDWQAMGFS
jgi:hypothetical protein